MGAAPGALVANTYRGRQLSTISSVTPDSGAVLMVPGLCRREGRCQPGRLCHILLALRCGPTKPSFHGHLSTLGAQSGPLASRCCPHRLTEPVHRAARASASPGTQTRDTSLDVLYERVLNLSSGGYRPAGLEWRRPCAARIENPGRPDLFHDSPLLPGAPSSLSSSPSSPLCDQS